MRKRFEIDVFIVLFTYLKYAETQIQDADSNRGKIYVRRKLR